MSFSLIALKVALHSLLKNKYTNKCSSLALILISLHKCLRFRTLYLTCGLDMTMRAQCQSNMLQNDTFFRTAYSANLKHVKEWHMFQNGNTWVQVHVLKFYYKDMGPWDTTETYTGNSLTPCTHAVFLTLAKQTSLRVTRIMSLLL